MGRGLGVVAALHTHVTSNLNNVQGQLFISSDSSLLYWFRAERWYRPQGHDPDLLLDTLLSCPPSQP